MKLNLWFLSATDEVFDLQQRLEKVEDHFNDFAHRLETIEVFSRTQTAKNSADIRRLKQRVVLIGNNTDLEIIPTKARLIAEDFAAFPHDPDFERGIPTGLRLQWWHLAVTVFTSFVIGLLATVLACLLCMKKQAAASLRQLGEELGGDMEVRRMEVIA